MNNTKIDTPQCLRLKGSSVWQAAGVALNKQPKRTMFVSGLENRDIDLKCAAMRREIRLNRARRTVMREAAKV